ncbi:MAG: Arm DNA-binding domain-containing protein [Sphingobium sp.]|uniref:Arm DNA-binding domain-containing protein n=1 Tax=Sphingobium sp. CECT 9361 TaxID=2845384 RepID=UPI001E61F71E|nr:Arm DNA-binding domain-containing protein [Sphingobium sp. CECT 9361]CAH0348292.1 hypothetical protein SPH9361_00026 [Sphingobium sp. CECT 9361]
MLTTVEIRALKPAARPFKVPDADGLFLLVQPTGALLWRFRYKVMGVERKLSLGSFPDVSLKQARLKRDEARASLIDGVDPVEEKRQRRFEAELAAKTTFKLVAEEYIQKMELEGKSPATIKKARWFLELLDDITKRPITSITPHELWTHLSASNGEAIMKPRCACGRLLGGSSDMGCHHQQLFLHKQSRKENAFAFS